MARIFSRKKAKKVEKGRKKGDFGKKKSKLNKKFVQFRDWRRLRKAERVQPHRSFRRTYREDYRRKLEIPGMMAHIFATFRAIFGNFRLFLPLLVIAVVIDITLVGLMSEATYQQFQEVLDTTNQQLAGGDIGQVAKAGLLLVSSITSGGFSGDANEAAMVFGVLMFLMVWLTTIYLLRQRMAKRKVKLRDGLYNGMAPLVPTLLVFIVAAIQCLPILVLVIVYSSAVQTEFLATPFYALLFFIFGSLMVLLSGYLLSSSLMALVAVSAPGLYPMKALTTASDLMMGRRVRFILRLITLLIVIMFMYIVVMLPVILFDLFIKQFEWAEGIPIVPVGLNIVTCFVMIYATAYLYIYYRWMLGYKEE